MTATTYAEDYETDWRNAVDHLTDRLDTSAVDWEVLRDEIEQLIDAAVEASHSDWEPGTECPECDGIELARWVSFPELAHHDNGYKTIRDRDSHGSVLVWECTECDALLSVSPAAVLLPMVGVEPDTDLDTFETAIRDSSASPDWRPGEPCPCGSSMIGEQPVDVEIVPATHGESSPHATGERISNLRYWCDECGQTLQENNAGVVFDELSM